MKKLINTIVQESTDARQSFFNANADTVIACAQALARSLDRGGKILLFGNGGSAADCQHLAAEFVNRYQIERRPLPAIALTTDTSIITAIGNDYTFDDIFAKQIQALGTEKDIAIGISTSGNSVNVIRAIEAASRIGMGTIGFSGRQGRLKEICETTFCVDHPSTPRIQEVHILLGHILCDLTERILFNEA